MSNGRVYTFTTLAMICFAANSLLCREALGGDSIDPVSFTTVRLVSGAAALLFLGRLFEPRGSRAQGVRVRSAL